MEQEFTVPISTKITILSILNLFINIIDGQTDDVVVVPQSFKKMTNLFAVSILNVTLLTVLEHDLQNVTTDPRQSIEPLDVLEHLFFLWARVKTNLYRTGFQRLSSLSSFRSMVASSNNFLCSTRNCLTAASNSPLFWVSRIFFLVSQIRVLRARSMIFFCSGVITFSPFGFLPYQKHKRKEQKNPPIILKTLRKAWNRQYDRGDFIPLYSAPNATFTALTI